MDPGDALCIAIRIHAESTDRRMKTDHGQTGWGCKPTNETAWEEWENCESRAFLLWQFIFILILSCSGSASGSAGGGGGNNKKSQRKISNSQSERTGTVQGIMAVIGRASGELWDLVTWLLR
ncbi:predicted protein [Histoplasma capsulatum H143]|uniref:Uncharacterized protein n=1 Tax=Ajellomyces capsulatus (strain H143) TaxID=544712 RepID=C6HPK8_AJECH|nr:predicted protein [Histoplasma capsulatum H143]